MAKTGDIHYLVCRMLRWEDIEVSGGLFRKQRLSRPDDEDVVGFIPVYKDQEAAIRESHDCDVIALRIGNELILKGESNGT